MLVVDGLVAAGWLEPITACAAPVPTPTTRSPADLDCTAYVLTYVLSMGGSIFLTLRMWFHWYKVAIPGGTWYHWLLILPLLWVPEGVLAYFLVIFLRR